MSHAITTSETVEGGDSFVGGYEDDSIEFEDQGDPESNAAELAEALGLCGDLTEIHLLVYAMRRYGMICDIMMWPVGKFEPHSRDSLDGADADDYKYLCDTVGEVFGAQSEEAQRVAFADVLAGDA